MRMIKNKKAVYDFADLILFLVSSVVIFSVLIMTVAIDQPTLYPRFNSDNFVTLLLYSQNSIFEYDAQTQKTEYGKVDLSVLKNLDDQYSVSPTNDYVSAKLTLMVYKPVIEQYIDIEGSFYYNQEFYDLWYNTRPINVFNYNYEVPVKYYDDDIDQTVDALLVIDVYANNLRAYDYG